MGQAFIGIKLLLTLERKVTHINKTGSGDFAAWYYGTNVNAHDNALCRGIRLAALSS